MSSYWQHNSPIDDDEENTERIYVSENWWMLDNNGEMCEVVLSDVEEQKSEENSCSRVSNQNSHLSKAFETACNNPDKTASDNFVENEACEQMPHSVRANEPHSRTELKCLDTESFTLTDTPNGHKKVDTIQTCVYEITTGEEFHWNDEVICSPTERGGAKSETRIQLVESYEKLDETFSQPQFAEDDGSSEWFENHEERNYGEPFELLANMADWKEGGMDGCAGGQVTPQQQQQQQQQQQRQQQQQQQQQQQHDEQIAAGGNVASCSSGEMLTSSSEQNALHQQNFPTSVTSDLTSNASDLTSNASNLTSNASNLTSNTSDLTSSTVAGTSYENEFGDWVMYDSEQFLGPEEHRVRTVVSYKDRPLPYEDESSEDELECSIDEVKAQFKRQFSEANFEARSRKMTESDDGVSGECGDKEESVETFQGCIERLSRDLENAFMQPTDVEEMAEVNSDKIADVKSEEITDVKSEEITDVKSEEITEVKSDNTFAQMMDANSGEISEQIKNIKSEEITEDITEEFADVSSVEIPDEQAEQTFIISEQNIEVKSSENTKLVMEVKSEEINENLIDLRSEESTDETIVVKPEEISEEIIVAEPAEISEEIIAVKPEEISENIIEVEVEEKSAHITEEIPEEQLEEKNVENPQETATPEVFEFVELSFEDISEIASEGVFYSENDAYDTTTADSDSEDDDERLVVSDPDILTTADSEEEEISVATDPGTGCNFETADSENETSVANVVCTCLFYEDSIDTPCPTHKREYISQGSDMPAHVE